MVELPGVNCHGNSRSTYKIQEEAINAAIVRAFRSRAAALRIRAAAGVTTIEGSPPTTVVASEARPLLRFADDWDQIAEEIERGAL